MAYNNVWIMVLHNENQMWISGRWSFSLPTIWWTGTENRHWTLHLGQYFICSPPQLQTFKPQLRTIKIIQSESISPWKWNTNDVWKMWLRINWMWRKPFQWWYIKCTTTGSGTQEGDLCDIKLYKTGTHPCCWWKWGLDRKIGPKSHGVPVLFLLMAIY